MTGQSIVSKLYTSIKSDVKGEKGIIGVIGGSIEYTGAPFFSAISALRSGADLVHVFCDESASIPIKSYSPECIVHPILCSSHSLSLSKLEESFNPFTRKLSALVVGPGLSLNENLQRQAEQLVNLAFCSESLKVIVFDADSFAMVARIHAFFPKKTCILTPNEREFGRFLCKFNILTGEELASFLKVHILEKGPMDTLYFPHHHDTTLKIAHEKIVGTGRRCAGQGDLLAGALAALLSLSQNESDIPQLVSFGSLLIRRANEIAFQQFGWSTITSDIQRCIPQAFQELF